MPFFGSTECGIEHKPEPTIVSSTDGAERGTSGGLDTEKVGTSRDQRDMARLGKKQEFTRNFEFLSILGFTCILMSTWETQLAASSFGLINGGLAGLIYMYLFTFAGFLAVIASMAEMASMAPTSGGQYHWVSEFAPKSCQKFLSYVTGWICVLGWQTGITSVAFLAGTQIQGLLVLNDPSYVFKQWHGTLLVIAISVIAIIFNTVLVKQLPMVEGTILMLHIFGFLAILIPLWVLAPRNSAKDVFTVFSDGGNWGSMGLSTLIGVLSPALAFIGPDSATHMSEEIRDASRILPIAMMVTVVLNGVLGFVMLVTFCFCITDVQTALNTPTGYPFIAVFHNATNSNAGTTGMTCILIVLTVCGCISNVATASRQLFAFARDNGLPFSSFLAYVNPGYDVPLRSIFLSFLITVLLSLINIGSSVAFEAIASLGVACLFSSYIVSMCCLRIKRFRSEYLPPSRWSMGRYAGTVNTIAILYLVLVFVLCFFPEARHIHAATFNWNVVIYVTVVAFAVVFYLVKGRHTYAGPVVLIKRE
ncbi:MAG: amino acid transporter [Lasallia pustulata]|uniref:Amino acid transporter n=1 Tax=Lasallia pustulata TaxID=136370 RepID=A0A5M8PYF2_9LECA|nr:MAG: amino acid transporter [Lasallia pustulata]